MKNILIIKARVIIGQQSTYALSILVYFGRISI